MKKWIRFEDRYGVFSIYQSITNTFELGNREILGYKIDNDIYVSSGNSSAWQYLSKLEVETIERLGVEEIYLVFDVDDLQGDKSKLLRVEDMQNVVETYNCLPSSVHVYYMPIVYAAETLSLIQFCDVKTIPLELMSVINTNKLQNNLLKLFTGHNNKEYIKKTINYLNIQDILKWIKLQGEKSFVVDKCYSWLSAKCALRPEYFMTSTGVIDFIRKLHVWWNEQIGQAEDFITLYKGEEVIKRIPVKRDFKVVDKKSQSDLQVIEMCSILVGAKLRKIGWMKYAVEGKDEHVKSQTAADAIKQLSIKEEKHND